MVKKFVRICVAPEFARIMKVKASLANKRIIEYTEGLVDDTIIKEMETRIKPKKQEQPQEQTKLKGHARFLDELGF